MGREIESRQWNRVVVFTREKRKQMGNTIVVGIEPTSSQLSLNETA
jgi:hypothetical protein